MSKLIGALVGFLVLCGLAGAQSPGTPNNSDSIIWVEERCRFSIEILSRTGTIDRASNGPHLRAYSIAFAGMFGGEGEASALGLLTGGSVVVTATGSFRFKVEHHKLASCSPAMFQSEGTMRSRVRTSIWGDDDDYALVAGGQHAEGIVLPSLEVDVLAQNSGTPMPQQTVSFGIGRNGPQITFQVPPIASTGDTDDKSQKEVAGGRALPSEVEIISGWSWVKIKDIATSTLFEAGGFAYSFVDSTLLDVKTKGSCAVHNVDATWRHDVDG